MKPTGPGHDRWGDATAAYLLGALDDGERGAFEAHLAGCPACLEEVAELRAAVEALPVSAPPVTPPPALRARIMADVEREAALLAAAGEPRATVPARPGAPARRRWWRLGAVPAWATATAALAALAIGLLAGTGLFGPGQRVVTAQVDPAQARGARVELVIRDGRGTLVSQRLPAPPGGRVYQVWTLRPGGRPQPTTTLFTPRRDGSATASVPGSLHGVQQVLVSAEPRGGSPAPTTTPILSARPD